MNLPAGVTVKDNLWRLTMELGHVRSPILALLLETLGAQALAWDKRLVLTKVHDTNRNSLHNLFLAVDFRAHHGFWTPTEENLLISACETLAPVPPQHAPHPRLVFHSGGSAGTGLTSDRTSPNYHGHLQAWSDE